jgi:ribosomal protein S18 acetylase RimI-like enzyme
MSSAPRSPKRRRGNRRQSPPSIPADALRAYNLPVEVLNGEARVRSTVTASDIAWAIRCVEGALKQVYEEQDDDGLRWDGEEKVREMNDKDQRFLVADRQKEADDPSGRPTGKASLDGSDESKGLAEVQSQRLGFVSYRIDIYDGCDSVDQESGPSYAVYVYELFVAEGARGRGVAQFLLRLLEQVCSRAGVHLIVLTVFKVNCPAMTLYTKQLGYSVDETSPERCGVEYATYKILSKRLPASIGK